MINRLLGSFAVLIFLCGSANATLLVGYLPDAEPATGVSASAISAGSGLESYDDFEDCAGIMSFCNIVNIGDGSTTPALAVANNDYFEFSVSALDGGFFNLDSLDFLAQKGGAADPRGWLLRTSVDSFFADVSTALVTCNPYNVNCITPDSFSIDLTTAAFQGLASIDFRIYTFTPGANLVMNYSQINVNGELSVANVSAPATFGMLTLGLACISFFRRRNG